MTFSYPVTIAVQILITADLGTLGYIHLSQGTGWRALTSALSFNCGKFGGEQKKCVRSPGRRDYYYYYYYYYY